MAKRPRIHPGRDASPGVTKRPEDKRGGDANAHYDRDEAARYTSQNDKVQRELTECALDLLVLQPAERVGPLLIADIGCGSGLSSDVIKARGHVSVGLDASQAMLETGEGAATGAVLRGDFGQGLPFRERCFDGVVSISAAQWLCQGDDDAAIDARLGRFFGSLHTMLRPGARACLQVYPRDVRETRRMERAMQAARLFGCAVTAFPHSNNAKKIFLCCVRDPRPTHEDNERYWTGFKQGYAQEGANALSEFITRTHHFFGVQSEGVECFPVPGTISSMPLTQWCTENENRYLDHGNHELQREMHEIRRENLSVNTFGHGCPRCPLGWPHATTCVRAWFQFLHHYRLLGAGQYWDDQNNGVYTYFETGDSPASLRSVQMHKQWNRRLTRMLRRARSLIREEGRATGGWNVLPLDLAVEEDFGVRPDLVDVPFSFVGTPGHWTEGGMERPRPDKLRGPVLPCHNQIGVDGFPPESDMPHGWLQYGKVFTRRDRRRAGTLLPGELESSAVTKNTALNSDEFRFRATSELFYMDVNALVERGGFHFPRPRDPRADDAVVLMQEGFFDADSAAGTLGVFAVEINWPDGKGTDGSIRRFDECVVAEMAADMSTAVSHYLTNTCNRAVAGVDVIHCTREADSFPGMVNDVTAANKSQKGPMWHSVNYGLADARPRVHTVQIWAMWWPQTNVGGATDFPIPNPLQDHVSQLHTSGRFKYLALALLGLPRDFVTPMRTPILIAHENIDTYQRNIKFDGPLATVKTQLVRGAKSLDAVEAAAWERIKATKGPRTKARPSRDIMKR